MLDTFLPYLWEQYKNHSIYVWGAQGQKAPVVTESWIRRKETSKRNAARAVAYWKEQVQNGYGNSLRAFDCSGLAVYYLMQQGYLDRDKNANLLMKQCILIPAASVRSGDFVFRVNKRTGVAYHIGCVADDQGTVIEARGRSAGVARGSTAGWDAYGRPPYFRTRAGAEKNRVLALHTPYCRGDDAKQVQQALLARGYAPGAADGVYGPGTERAIRAFQKDAGLTADGKAGAKTFAALGLAFVAD